MGTDLTLKPFSFVWETYDPVYHSTLKLKATTDSSAALSIRNQMGTYGSYVLGVGLKNLGTKNKVNFGVQVDLNIWWPNLCGIFLQIFYKIEYDWILFNSEKINWL